MRTIPHGTPGNKEPRAGFPGTCRAAAAASDDLKPKEKDIPPDVLLFCQLFRHGSPEPGQVLLVRVADGPVKVFQHGGAPGAVLHGCIAVPHRLGHFSLAHISSHHRNAGGQIFLHPAQDLGKVGGGAAKPGGAEEEYLLVRQTL